MLPHQSADNTAERSASFGCRWRLEGREAASVRVSGEVDIATVARLDEALREALGYARLVVLDLRRMSFMDSSGLRVVLDTAERARASRARIVLTGASAQVQTLLDVTRTREQLDLLETRRAYDLMPFENTASVLTARVMAVSDAELWLQAADGTIHRPWTPEVDELPLPAGSAVELYLDDDGAVSGWREPGSGLAIDQRHLAPGDAQAEHADLACEGPCGRVWLAPAAARLAEHQERCLTCAGSLVLR